jgi:thiol-disulfide isomerase/thioredoxin
MSMSRLSFVALALTMGCVEAELEVPGLDDATLDGKNNAGNGNGGPGVDDGTDSDMDGWTDAEEELRNTDPLSALDVPYTGGWPIGDCRNDVEADSSLSQGGIAPNFEGVDMYGDTVRLHDFCHMAVMVVTGAEWCGPCNEYRATMGQYFENYFDRGLMIIDLLGETTSGEAITEADLVSWADGHSYAVVNDDGWPITNQGYASGGIPAMSLIAPGGEVISLNGGDPGGIIEANLPADFVMPDYVHEDMANAGAGH